MGKPALWQFKCSHFCEKVRWALDFKRIEHRRVSLYPGWHAVPTLLVSGQQQVPLLRVEGRTSYELYSQWHREGRLRLHCIRFGYDEQLQQVLRHSEATLDEASLRSVSALGGEPADIVQTAVQHLNVLPPPIPSHLGDSDDEDGAEDPTQTTK